MARFQELYRGDILYADGRLESCSVHYIGEAHAFVNGPWEDDPTVEAVSVTRLQDGDCRMALHREHNKGPKIAATYWSGRKHRTPAHNSGAIPGEGDHDARA